MLFENGHYNIGTHFTYSLKGHHPAHLPYVYSSTKQNIEVGGGSGASWTLSATRHSLKILPDCSDQLSLWLWFPQV